MISKRIVEEIVEITADIIGIDKSLMRRKSLRDDTGKLHQFRSVVCYILMYDLNMRSQFLYTALDISPSQLSRHSGKVLANDEYIDQVRSHIATHGLLNPEKLKSFNFSDPNNYKSVQQFKK